MSTRALPSIGRRSPRLHLVAAVAALAAGASLAAGAPRAAGASRAADLVVPGPTGRSPVRAVSIQVEVIESGEAFDAETTFALVNEAAEPVRLALELPEGLLAVEARGETLALPQDGRMTLDVERSEALAVRVRSRVRPELLDWLAAEDAGWVGAARGAVLQPVKRLGVRHVKGSAFAAAPLSVRIALGGGLPVSSMLQDPAGLLARGEASWQDVTLEDDDRLVLTWPALGPWLPRDEAESKALLAALRNRAIAADELATVADLAAAQEDEPRAGDAAVAVRAEAELRSQADRVASRAEREERQRAEAEEAARRVAEARDAARVAEAQRMAAERTEEAARVVEPAPDDAARVAEAQREEAARTETARVAEAQREEASRTEAARVAEAQREEAARTEAARVAEAQREEAARTEAARVAETQREEAARTEAARVAEATPPRATPTERAAERSRREDAARLARAHRDEAAAQRDEAARTERAQRDALAAAERDAVLAAQRERDDRLAAARAATESDREAREAAEQRDREAARAARRERLARAASEAAARDEREAVARAEARDAGDVPWVRTASEARLFVARERAAGLERARLEEAIAVVRAHWGEPFATEPEWRARFAAEPWYSPRADGSELEPSLGEIEALEVLSGALDGA